MRSDSDQTANQVPVKEVSINEFYNANDERVNKLTDFKEPVSHDEVQVVLEYEITNESNMEVSAIELKPSVKLDNSEDSDDNGTSEMSSDIRNDSMFDLFNKSSSNNTNKCLERPVSNFALNPYQKYNQAMLDIDTYNALDDITIHKTTFINNPKHNIENTRNKANYDFATKFNSHTIQCDDRKTAKNVKYEMRKRSLSKNKPSADSIKKEAVSSYIKKSIESLNCNEQSNFSSSLEKQLITDYNNMYYKDTGSKKNASQPSKKPKVSKPTKTIIMNILPEKPMKYKDNSLRNSKESISFGDSVKSKKTPINNSSCNKQTVIYTAKSTALISSEKTKELSSATTEKNKSEKQDRNNVIKNCKSQACFQKNPVYSTNKVNRLKKLKNSLDKQQNIINAAKNAKTSALERTKPGMRSNSRNVNEDLHDVNKENCHPNSKVSRSRSKTAFDNKLKAQEKKPVKKTNIYTLNEHKVNKLSRNNSKEPMSIKTKSFLKPSINSISSIYKTNLKNEPYTTFGTNKSSTGKSEIGFTSDKQKFSKFDRRSKDKQPIKENKEYPAINNVRQINLAESKDRNKNNQTYKKNLSELLHDKARGKPAR